MTLHRDVFYAIKPLMPRLMQLALRRAFVRWQRKSHRHVWPVDPKTATPPAMWPGWPEGRQFAFVLSHDVDTQKGLDTCHRLASIETELGFRSAFNFVPERYGNSEALRDHLRRDGFEIGVHGLRHDGKLFRSYEIFRRRAARINQYLAAWNARGFTSPSMHHNLEWMRLLDISHSTSTFDTDPFEPQPDGIGTIFPFWVENHSPHRGFVELPYTLPQDFTLFILMRERTNTIWKEKLDWIASNGGMALVNTHSDYMNFDGTPPNAEEYPVDYYADFLAYVRRRYAGRSYHARPGDVADWARSIFQSQSVHPDYQGLN